MNSTNHSDIKKLVEEVLREITANGEGCGAACSPVFSHVEVGKANVCENPIADETDFLPDISEIDISSKVYVPSPENPEKLRAMKSSTPARIGVWRTGTRYKTETMLRFLADHAAARDAVHKEMPDNLVDGLKLPVIQTQCTSKDEYLTRPDLGRKLSPEGRALLEQMAGGERCQALIFFADGLSATAVDTNGRDTYLCAAEGLKRCGISLGTPFLVKYGRVPIEDEVSEITGAEVVVLLVGERPGLATAESMSAYICYKAYVGMNESRRTVISNIHKNGTPAVEAGAYIADIVKAMLEKKVSGIDLKL